MTDGPVALDTTSIDEPASAASAAGAGSTSSGDSMGAAAPEPTQAADLVRAIGAALLVAACVASPAGALVFAPFVPAIIALRLLRRGSHRRFLGTAVSAAIVFAVLPTRDDALLAASVGSALLLVPGLAIIHARAARLDPIEIAVRSSWPEPRLASGLTPTIVGWIVAVAIVGALAAPAAPSVERIGADVIEQAYAPYDDACSSDGALAESQSFCDELTSQQRTITRVVDDYAAELLAGLLAAFAFGAAATAHLIVLVRARRISDRIRPRWPLAQLELHWAFAYVLAAGLGAWLLAGSGDSVVSVAGRSLGVAAATIGALAVVSQGLGMSAWMLASRPRPIWFKVLLVAAFVLATPFVLVMLFVIGVLDLAVHPRRRAMASAAD